jgi:hypothetical protein
LFLVNIERAEVRLIRQAILMATRKKPPIKKNAGRPLRSGPKTNHFGKFGLLG